MIQRFARLAGALLVLGLASAPAYAKLELCNNTDSTVNVAIGYKHDDAWTTEGWWKAVPVKPGEKCLTLLKTPLVSRYYYIYALDMDKGGSWGGKSVMCIRNKIFTIKGFDKCDERGFQKAGFFEVDTGDDGDWTISLSGEKTTPASN